jgi:hypothetical protein
MTQVASTCSLSLFSICQNLLSFMVEESMTLETVTEGAQGVVGGNQGSFTFLCIRPSALLSYTNQCH